MRTYVKIIILFFLLVSGIDMRGEIVVIGSQLTIYTNRALNSDAESSFQLLSLEDEVREDSNIFFNGSFFRGEIELGEKNIIQGFAFSNLRIRKSTDLSSFFRIIMRQLSFRDEQLVLDKSKLFYSNINHYVLPSCQYYIFTLRRIII